MANQQTAMKVQRDVLYDILIQPSAQWLYDYLLSKNKPLTGYSSLYDLTYPSNEGKDQVVGLRLISDKKKSELPLTVVHYERHKAVLYQGTDLVEKADRKGIDVEINVREWETLDYIVIYRKIIDLIRYTPGDIAKELGLHVPCDIMVEKKTSKRKKIFKMFKS